MKKVVYIDMDGVVADFDSAIKAAIPNLNNPEIWNDDELRKKFIDNYVEFHPRFFKSLKPIEHAIESVLELMKHYDVYFLSTPMYAIPESYMDKRIWLAQHFGEAAKKRLILSHRKDLLIGRFLIDDRTAHGADRFKGLHIKFGDEVFPNWEAVIEFLVNYKIHY